MPDSIYVFESTNTFLINKRIEERIVEFHVDPFNIMHYDLLETNPGEVLEDLQTIAFFSELKVIVVRHIETLLDASEGMLKAWVKYFEKPNPDVILMIELNEAITATHPLGDAINKYAYIEKIKDPTQEEYPGLVREIFSKADYKITDAAILTLLERTNYEFTLLHQEAEKLQVYAIDKKIINEQDVMLLVSRNLEEHIYELTNALLSYNQAKTIEIFYDLISRNEDPLRILNFIVNKIRELMHARLMIDKGNKQEDIAQYFHISSGRAYYLVKNAKEVQVKVLEKHLEKLGQLDFEIKSGKIDKKLGLELYLLGV